MFGFLRFRAPARAGSKTIRKRQSTGLQTRFEQLEPRSMLAGDPILHWNAIALEVVSRDHTSPNGTLPPPAQQAGPGKTSRALAIVHTAMFDAVNSIYGHYEPYMIKVVGVAGASVDAAIGQAAHDTLVALYSEQSAFVSAALDDWMGDIKNGKAETMGKALGHMVAKTILKAREKDGWKSKSHYEITDAPGHHQYDPLNPDQGLLDPNWGNVDTFGIKNTAKFMPPPPPDMDSAAYTKAFNEVLRLGGDGEISPTQRTEEQTQIGLFWAYDGTQGMCAPPRMYNQIAVTIAQDQGNTMYENARLLALVNIAMADAGIVGWDSKYSYDFWRPVVGIRQADQDGNPHTDAIADWTPLGAPASNETFPNDFSPPFPAYVSGHAIFGAALFKTLEYYYGTNDISFTISSDEFNGETTGSDGVVRPEITRSFTSLRKAAWENGMSRIYLGIHWRFDMDAGIRAGNRIAVNIFKNLMEPLKKRMPTGGINNTLTSYYRVMIATKMMEMDDNVERQVVMMQTTVTPDKMTVSFNGLSPYITPFSLDYGPTGNKSKSKAADSEHATAALHDEALVPSLSLIDPLEG